MVFDIGGTSMRAAAVEGEVLGEIRKVSTPQEPKEGLATLFSIIREFDGSITAITGDFAGRVRNGIIDQATNLPRWNGVHIEEEISNEFRVPTHVVNDAILVGFGEKNRGAGRGFSDVAYLTVSTGVGGALIRVPDLANSPLLGSEFPELKPRLESQISGTAVTKKFGVHPKELHSLDERNKLADILADGIVEISAVWKPDVFVLGGSMIVGTNPIPLERVEERLRTRGVSLPVKMAELGDIGGLYGALALLNA